MRNTTIIIDIDITIDIDVGIVKVFISGEGGDVI